MSTTPCVRTTDLFPAHSLAANRVVEIDSEGDLVLAGSSDEGYIGFTTDAVHHGFKYGPGDVLARTYPDAVLLQVAAGQTFTPGLVAHVAADGKIATTGTHHVGVALEGGTGGEVIKVMPM